MAICNSGVLKLRLCYLRIIAGILSIVEGLFVAPVTCPWGWATELAMLIVGGKLAETWDMRMHEIELQICISFSKEVKITI